MLAFFIPVMFSGSFIVESVFAWPGMGRLGVNAVFSRDYPLIMGINLITVFMVLISNLGADIAYAALDPRIRYD
jgi:peptide/nickel transport system permease protein